MYRIYQGTMKLVKSALQLAKDVFLATIFKYIRIERNYLTLKFQSTILNFFNHIWLKLSD